MTKHEIYACLYAKEFPAQALLRLRPELRSKPCVVMEGEPPLEEICSLTRKARSLGMSRGMTRVEVDTFSEVIVLQRSLKDEATARAVLLECAGCYSPRVENWDYERSFLCAIDIAGTTGLFGPPATLARNLLTRVGTLGLTACVAVSSNFHAAVAVAKGPLPISVRIIPTGEESKALAALPLTVLDLTEEQAQTFALWGINTLGMLAALPEKELISRIGQAGKRLRQMARGEMPHLFQPVEPVFTLVERMELDSPVELLDALMFVVNVMLEQIILRATARVLALASVSVTLALEGGTTYTRTVQPALPTNDRQVWLKLLHLDLESHPPQAAILAVELDAESGSTSQIQLGLFSPQLPESSRLDVTLARIRAIVGDENVGRAVLTDTHQLDGFRIEPFSISSADPSALSSAPMRPAMRRLRPAETVFVTLQSERPKAFTFRERRYSVESAYGPWLTGGEWWTATLWGSEQWDLAVRTHDGVMLCVCLIRDLLRNQWQIVGLYD
ncbi:DNA polymerase Y family protein [Granulicella sp. S156]|uniref:DNA polymerase Y family protein n=1 Tax=Granulicella sp. S156 TaxID=1747224 RepID=UPI00131B6804|nr:DNA polymerase Y family protein [Granulicella sp. S156]